MRTNLQPYKQALAKANDSATTPKNIQVALYNSKERLNEDHASKSKSPSDNPNRTTCLERANSDLQEQFPETRLGSKQKQEESLTLSRTTLDEARKKKLNEDSATAHDRDDDLVYTSKAGTVEDAVTSYVESSASDLNALTTYEKVDFLQRDIDTLKQKIVSQKANKLKREIKALKQQLSAGPGGAGRGPAGKARGHGRGRGRHSRK